MANIKSAIKRNKQNEKRRIRNRVYRGSARSFIKKARVAIETGDQTTADSAVRDAVSALDKAAQKGCPSQKQCFSSKESFDEAS